MRPGSSDAQARPVGRIITLSCNGTSKLTATGCRRFEARPNQKRRHCPQLVDRTVPFTDHATHYGRERRSRQLQPQPDAGRFGVKGKPFTIVMDRLTE